MKRTDKYTFFYGGFLSQWSDTPFIINGLTYKTAEHYMMVEKARLFRDNSSIVKIITSKTPREAKRLGRLVKNFDIDIWNKHAREIVFAGILPNFIKIKKLLNFYYQQVILY